MTLRSHHHRWMRRHSPALQYQKCFHLTKAHKYGEFLEFRETPPECPESRECSNPGCQPGVLPGAFGAFVDLYAVLLSDAITDPAISDMSMSENPTVSSPSEDVRMECGAALRIEVAKSGNLCLYLFRFLIFDCCEPLVFSCWLTRGRSVRSLYSSSFSIWVH